MINFDRIQPELFIGSCPRSLLDIDRLKMNLRIGAVLSLQTDADLSALNIEWPKMEAHYLKSDMVIARLPINDWDAADLRIHLPDAALTLKQLVDGGYRTYVHCTAGVGRAPATVMGYLAWYRKMTMAQAIEQVKSRRDCEPYVDILQDVDAVMRTSRGR